MLDIKATQSIIVNGASFSIPAGLGVAHAVSSRASQRSNHAEAHGNGRPCMMIPTSSAIAHFIFTHIRALLCTICYLVPSLNCIILPTQLV